jgi:hypothetical protein
MVMLFEFFDSEGCVEPLAEVLVTVLEPKFSCVNC